MTEIANRDALGREQNAHQDIPHGGKPASPDAPRGNLSQGDTTLTTPDDASSINPETLAVRPDGISDEAWEALQEEIRRQSEHQPSLWERTPGYAKALAVFVTTGLTAWGIGHAVSSSSAPDQGKKIVATDTPNGGVATAVPPKVAATAGPTSLAGPTETAGVPVNPEQKKYDPRYYVLAKDFPAPKEALQALLNRQDDYLTSGDVRTTIEGQEPLPGDGEYLRAICANPKSQLAENFKARSIQATLFRGIAEQQTGKPLPLDITTKVDNITNIVKVGPNTYEVTAKTTMSSNAVAIRKEVPYLVNDSWPEQFELTETATYTITVIPDSETWAFVKATH